MKRSSQEETSTRSPFREWLERVGRVCDYIFPTAMSVSLGLLALLIFLIITRDTSWGPLKYAIPIIAVMMVIGYPTLLLANPTNLGLGWLGAIFSVACIYSPLILAAMAAALHLPTHDDLMSALYTMLTKLGTYLAVVSVVYLIIGHTWDIIAASRHRLLSLDVDIEMKRKMRLYTPVPKCWEMYACRETTRSVCPNFEDKTTCWKRRCGCLCESKFARVLLRQTLNHGESGHLDVTEIPEVREYAEHLRNTPRRPWSERKAYCHACPLFLEHQAIKYRNFNWISLPLAGGMMVLLFPIYHLVYVAFVGHLEKFAKTLIAAGRLPENFSAEGGSLINSPFEYVLLTAVALLVLAYVIDFTDHCLLEWKL